jgi:hypothetical protein
MQPPDTFNVAWPAKVPLDPSDPSAEERMQQVSKMAQALKLQPAVPGAPRRLLKKEGRDELVSKIALIRESLRGRKEHRALVEAVALALADPDSGLDAERRAMYQAAMQRFHQL